MKIHLLSDLHNEFDLYTPSLAAKQADIVVLAGDIDLKARGVDYARHAFACPVIYVPGNQEFYGGHLDTTLEKMRMRACARVRVLDNDEWIFNGVRFLGATCWTDYSSTGDVLLAKWDAHQGLTDFKKIRAAGYRKVQSGDFVMRNHKSLNWLRERLAERFGGHTVVVTHHAPSRLSIGDAHVEYSEYVKNWKMAMDSSSKIGSTYIKNISHLDASYANNWDELMGDSISLWLHGHTHYAVDYKINGTRIFSNPRGYPGESTGFDCDLLIDV
ncbi:MAG: metallophosphoesterase family protein [Methylobacter sp.]